MLSCARTPFVETASAGTGPTARRKRGNSNTTLNQLVATVATERDGDLAARQFGYDVRGDLRGIGEGLVVHARELGNDLQRIPGRYNQLGVVSTQVFGDRAGVA